MLGRLIIEGIGLLRFLLGIPQAVQGILFHLTVSCPRLDRGRHRPHPEQG